MAATFNSSIQEAKFEIIEWFVNEQNEDLVWATIQYVRDLKNKSEDYPERYPFAPQSDEELFARITKARQSEKWYSMDEMREKAKNWGK
jgi:hypothetical protein